MGCQRKRNDRQIFDETFQVASNSNLFPGCVIRVFCLRHCLPVSVYFHNENLLYTDKSIDAWQPSPFNLERKEDGGQSHQNSPFSAFYLGQFWEEQLISCKY